MLFEQRQRLRHHFAIQAGGGVNFRLTERLGARASGGYMRVFDSDEGVNVFRFAAGARLAF